MTEFSSLTAAAFTSNVPTNSLAIPPMEEEEDSEERYLIRLAIQEHDLNEDASNEISDAILLFADKAESDHHRLTLDDALAHRKLNEDLCAAALQCWPPVLPIMLSPYELNAKPPTIAEPYWSAMLATYAENEHRRAVRDTAVQIAFTRLLKHVPNRISAVAPAYSPAPRYTLLPGSRYATWLDGRRVIENEPSNAAPTPSCPVHLDAPLALNELDASDRVLSEDELEDADAAAMSGGSCRCAEFHDLYARHTAALHERAVFAEEAKRQILQSPRPLVYWVGQNAVTGSPDGIDEAVTDWPKYVPTPYSVTGDADMPEGLRAGVATNPDGSLDVEGTREAGVKVYDGRTPSEIRAEERRAEYEREYERKITERFEHLKIDAEARRRFYAEAAPTIGRTLSWDELEESSELPALVSGLLFSGETSLLIAKRNLGKSMFAVCLSGCVATGVDFLGRPVEQGRVLYIVSEGERGLYGRIRSWADGHGADWKSIRERVSIFGGGPNLSSDASLAELRRVIKDFDPTLIIFDTWTGLSGIVKEVEQGEQARVLHEVKNLSPTAHKLILHHPNAESEDTTAPKSRGGTALPSGVDTVMTLWSDHAHSDPALPGATFLALSTEEDHAGKQKEAARETIRGLYLAEGEGAPYLSIADRVLTASERWVIKNMPYEVEMTLPDLVEATGVARTTIQRHLEKAPAFVVRCSGSRVNGAVYKRIK